VPDSAIPTLDEQRRFWAWHWEHAEQRRVINDWTLARWEAILALVRSLALPSPRILDLGCGRGWFTDRLAQFGEATGFDLSDEAIAAARAEFPHVQFIAGNVYDAPLPAECFDLVVSQEVVAHVEDQSGYVDRAADVLKPGGYLIISTGNKFVIDHLGSQRFPAQPSHHIARQLNIRGLRNLLRGRFQVLRANTIIANVGDGGVLRFVNSYRLNALVGRVIPRRYLDAVKAWARLGYQLIAVARRRR
jgi:2-polyprenyl-3-methyl-5-hydroxy-6-metoxy-1,4-benzoquinol methylase